MGDGYCELVSTERIYKSVFSARAGSNIVLDRNGQKYYCKLVTPMRKQDNVLFDEHGKVVFVKKVVIADYYRAEDYFFDTEEGAKKIIVVNPGARKIYVTDGLNNSEIQSGDRVMGYFVYRTDNFINAIDRKYL